MKAKVVGTYLSLGFTLLSIVLIVLASIIDCRLLENIGFSILGSAVISLVISLSDYFAVRKETLEEAYISAAKYNDLISKISYLYFSEEYNLLMKYNSEKRKNSQWKPLGLPIDDKVYRRIVEYYQIEGLNDSDRLVFLQQKEDEFKNCINRIALSVRAATESGSDSLSHSFGKMYYLFDFSKTKLNKFYREIYHPLFELDCFLNDVNSSFERYYRYNEGNIYMATDAIKKLNERLFETTENNSITPANLTVYKSFYSDMRNRIEKFRTTIFRKEVFESLSSQIDSVMIVSPDRATVTEDKNVKE